ncbi:MAG: 4Fe-4S binding protein [Thermoplasmata archaeon]|nr:4Fe-4S binding protein [Thermoplasmata archaeon]
MPYDHESIPPTPITSVPSDQFLKTGSWRTFRPVIDRDKCIKCFICWKFCPDVSVRVKDEDSYPEIDYEFCKGCGICARECPKDAIDMVLEV